MLKEELAKRDRQIDEARERWPSLLLRALHRSGGRAWQALPSASEAVPAAPAETGGALRAVPRRLHPTSQPSWPLWASPEPPWPISGRRPSVSRQKRFRTPGTSIV